ncbi:MAG TPA: hypothetical protein VNO31_12510, partial [Umezawaea sp.]|nr:hypothetical protein [Umezawaea sp.]
MATLASALVFAGTAVPAAAGAQPVSEPAVTGDAPDVVAGHATAAPAVKLDRPVTAGKSDCSPEALDAKTAVPLGAEAGPGLQGLKGITCTAERTTGGSPPGARDAALAKLRAGESAPASTLSKRLVGVRGGQEPNAADYIQPPQFCFDHAFDGWWGTRTEMCQITWGLINLYVVDSSGVRTLVGQAEWLEYDFAYTTDIIDTWAHQIRTTKYWSTGVGNTPATINGYAWCGGDCKQNSDTGLRPTSFVTDTNNDGEAYYDSTRGER